jgi:hypothetical protein
MDRLSRLFALVRKKVSWTIVKYEELSKFAAEWLIR